MTIHLSILIFWPLVFGVLPVGLAYHAAYTLAVSVVMASSGVRPPINS